MRLADFEMYRELLHRHTGVDLTPDKSSLLDARLTPIAKKWGYPTFESMTIALRGVPENALIIDVVEAMMMNETMFFRDARPFEDLKNTIIPYLAKERAKYKSLRFWSAGCSTGEEPYSIAMAVKECGTPLKNWDIDIIGTDISHSVLSKAREGHYSQFDVQRGLPSPMLIKYFHQADGGGWQLDSSIMNMVDFLHSNLLDPVRDLGPFDVIFCRNVLCAMDDAAQTRILDNLARTLEPDGFLILGDEETLPTSCVSLRPLPDLPGFYGPADGTHRMDRLEKLKKTSGT